MLKNRQNIIKMAILGVGIILVCVLAVFAFKKSHTSKGNAGDQAVVTEETGAGEETADGENTHADALDEASEVEDEGEQILLLPKEEVYGFSMTDSNGIRLNFELDGENWIYTDDTTIAIDNDRIDKILNYLCDIRATDSIALDSEEAALEYGLSQESKLCIIKDAGGNEILISLGNVDETTGNVYFALNYDFTNIYVNSGKLANVCDYAIEEIIAL
jgi:hypothetical protein